MRLTKDQAQIAVKKLKDKLIRRFGDKVMLYLFGSVARGDFGPESDIDVLVIIDGEVNIHLKEEVIDLAFEVGLECNVIFGVIVYSDNEWDSDLYKSMPIHWAIDKEGIKV